METITNEKEQIEEIFTEEALHQRHVSDFIPQKLEGVNFSGFSFEFWELNCTWVGEIFWPKHFRNLSMVKIVWFVEDMLPKIDCIKLGLDRVW